MAKIITKKSQIPKSAQKKIKNFSKLTDNQAIYQYELNKLVNRAKGDFGSFLKGYYEMPDRVYKKHIEEIRQLRYVKLRHAREKYETERRINRIVLDRIEYEQPRVEKPLIEKPVIDYGYTGDIYSNSDIIDLNDLIEKEKQYQSTQEYLQETGLRIDPFTGELLPAEQVEEKIRQRTDVSGSEDLRPTKEEADIAELGDSVEDFLNNLEQYVRDEEDKAIQSNSSYRSGRSRSQKSREWIENNITKAGDMILREIDKIRPSDENLKKFAKKFSNQNNLQALTDAIGEYLAAAYHSSNTTGAFQSSKVYGLLHDGPVSMAETMEFEDEE